MVGGRWCSVGCDVWVTVIVLMLRLLRWWRVGLVALAQAAAGQVEEDVVEGRPDHLDPYGGGARPGQVGDQAGRQVAAVRDPDGERRVGDPDGRAVDPLGPGSGGEGVARLGEAQRHQVAQRRLQPGCAVVGDQPAVVDDQHPVRDRVRLLEVVGGQHDRGAQLAVEPLHLLLEVDPVLRVQTRRRLVEEEDPRRVDEADRHVEPAALAARQRGDRAAGVLGEVERLEQLVGPRVRGGPRQAVRPALADDLVAAALHVARGVALADVPDRTAYVAPAPDHVVPRDLGGAGGRLDQRGEHPQGGGLAGPVGAEEGDELPLVDLDVQAADGLDGLLVPRERLGESRGPDHWLCVGHTRTLETIQDSFCPQYETIWSRYPPRPSAATRPPIRVASRRCVRKL